MIQGMKSVMVFEPRDTDEQTVTKWMNWNRNKSSYVGDKAVPNAEETRMHLRKYEKQEGIS